MKHRKPRNSNRGTLQHIEDTFSDLSLIEQAAMIETLTKLHRWCSRERDRSPKTGEQAEAAGRSDYAAVTAPHDPGELAAMLGKIEAEMERLAPLHPRLTARQLKYMAAHNLDTTTEDVADPAKNAALLLDMPEGRKQ